MYVRRKVFSTVEQPEEQLFSVEMNEQEYALFSAFKAGYEEAMYSRAVKTEDVIKRQELGKKVAAAKQEQAALQAESEALTKKHIKKADKVAKQAEIDAKLAAAKQAEEAGKTTGKLNKAAEAQKLAAKQGKGSVKAADKAAKQAILKSNAKNFLKKNKVALGIGAGVAGGAALAGGGMYGYKKVAAKKD